MKKLRMIVQNMATGLLYLILLLGLVWCATWLLKHVLALFR